LPMKSCSKSTPNGTFVSQESLVRKPSEPSS
jgi:hypothetical protein